MRRPFVSVVGAANFDLISYIERMPKTGETIHGRRFGMGCGGKGANQAVMAAKLGAGVTIVTKLGDDIFGHRTLENFKSFGVNTDHVHLTEKALSGVAPITVDREGNNSIIIVTGANDLLTVQELEAAREDIAAAGLLITQLEIPLETTLCAMRIAREEGAVNLFNPAPAFADLPDEIFTLSDIICPNETEAELLTGIRTDNLDGAERAGRALLDKGAKVVVMTLGGNGSLIMGKDTSMHVQGIPVDAKDTTGAGDCFIGSFAYFYACGLPLDEAARRANRIAAVSVQHPGTQTSYPDAVELPKGIFESL